MRMHQVHGQADEGLFTFSSSADRGCRPLDAALASTDRPPYLALYSIRSAPIGVSVDVDVDVGDGVGPDWPGRPTAVRDLANEVSEVASSQNETTMGKTTSGPIGSESRGDEAAEAGTGDRSEGSSRASRVGLVTLSGRRRSRPSGLKTSAGPLALEPARVPGAPGAAGIPEPLGCPNLPSNLHLLFVQLTSTTSSGARRACIVELSRQFDRQPGWTAELLFSRPAALSALILELVSRYPAIEPPTMTLMDLQVSRPIWRKVVCLCWQDCRFV
ncbi:unnamed protein product [Protopolystoma xenopodis]|uniref:Uncharacterized protein n=1 Tax=Protopolystoma xenopodis TaxID=117903 RepID=A0A3S5CJC3_9PLAT|nr:unnamed protein product [Protopolystoma xenopodis]